MKVKSDKRGGIKFREIMVVIIVIIFLGSSAYMLLAGMMTGKAQSRVTVEEVQTARAAMDYDDYEDTESNVKVAVFENDIVISGKGTQKQRQSGANQPGAVNRGEDMQPVKEDSGSEYIFPDSDTERLTDADVAGMSKADLRKARNEILARRGRIFDSEDLKTYFEGKSWYAGTIAPKDFDKNMDSRLNAIELYNIEMIKKYE